MRLELILFSYVHTRDEMSMMNALNPVDEFIQICSYRETDRLDVQSEEKMRLCPPTPSRSAVGALALGVALLERSVINHEWERAGIPGEIHDELDDDWKSSQAVIIHRGAVLRFFALLQPLQWPNTFEHTRTHTCTYLPQNALKWPFRQSKRQDH